MSNSGRWPRDVFTEAVWSSDLTPPQRLVALAFADHARERDTAWVKWERLAARTGLGRSTAARALAALVSLGWLVEVEAARQHYSTRYRLTPQQSQSGTPEQSQSGTPGCASSPALATSSPRAGPDCSSDLRPDNNNDAREEVEVLVNPEDREPHSQEHLADRLRGAGVSWTDREIDESLRRLIRIFGDDAAAMTPAAALLMALATRRPRPVERIGAYLASLTDDQVRALRPAPSKKRRRDTRRPLGCAACGAGPTPLGFIGTDAEDRYVPCPKCKPHLVKGSAA